MQFVNIAAYKFVTLSLADLPSIRAQLKARAIELDLKGTVLLSVEGINLFLAGKPDAIADYKNLLMQWDAFKDLRYKESYSDYQPFKRMLVRIKDEIIAMGCEQVQPAKQTAPYLDPETLKQWYAAGKEMVIIDTRNNYEVKYGSFMNAVDLNIETFRDFPAAVEQLPEEIKSKPVVTFCTGGIRCEKASELLRQKGFKEVYQLEGGILNYFKKCGGDYFSGACFVFDERMAVDHHLREISPYFPATSPQIYLCN